ncbi:phosphopantothenoylcysteine decarboxylase [Euwallacea fornicatus]|uniref:phosphopantothenoylcysteine decarboxylase n=1 Tax=Euwallacea fornicatus TaxID=995702 RepID=UPI00338F0C07
MVNVLIGCTGSVATIKLPNLISSLKEEFTKKHQNIKIRVATTERAKHFFKSADLGEDIDVFSDSDEWNAWQKRGDEVVHVELSKWADVLLVAPLDANSLGKIASGICDNILLCTARAWDLNKPLIFCPAMNTKMYIHPVTAAQISTLKSWGYIEVPVIEKTLICGDTGLGAMAEVSTIVQTVVHSVEV